MQVSEHFKMPKVKEIKPGRHHEVSPLDLAITAGSVALASEFVSAEPEAFEIPEEF